MRKLLSMSLVLALPMVVASSAMGVFHPLEGLDPGGFNVNNPSGWFRGWQFTVNADDITVTELGLNMPMAGDTVMLELWDSSTQSLIASTGPVTTQANVWQYFDLDTSVALDNGGTYVVGIFSSGQASYYYASGLSDEWYPTGDIEYQTMLYHNNTYSSYPTSSLNGYHYGVPDIGYVIPGPGALALLGLAGLVGRRRR